MSHTSKRVGENRFVVSLVLLLAGLTAFWAADHLPRGASPDPAATQASAANEIAPVRATPIESLRCGRRVTGRNPVREQVDIGPEPDAATWRLVKLHMTKSDGRGLDIELLRPIDWIEAEAAAPGAAVFLDLIELGAFGDATVLSIEPCPTIESGAGHVVTGRFIHEAGETIDVRVEGVDPIGCTANHPFWSADREEFVAAGELLEGERVLLHNGETKRVVQLLPRPGPEVVYNLEVHGEHVYEVTPDGVLVHNEYTKSSARGRTVYKSSHAFDAHAMPSVAEDAVLHPNVRRLLDDGATNLDLMRKGYAPIGHDGYQVNLHHLIGQEPGPMVELQNTTHFSNYSALHGVVGAGESFRNSASLRGKYDRFRRAYWMLRAEDFE